MTGAGVGDQETIITRARGLKAASWMPACMGPQAVALAIGVEAVAAQS